MKIKAAFPGNDEILLYLVSRRAEAEYVERQFLAVQDECLGTPMFGNEMMSGHQFLAGTGVLVQPNCTLGLVDAERVRDREHLWDAVQRREYVEAENALLVGGIFDVGRRDAKADPITVDTIRPMDVRARQGATHWHGIGETRRWVGCSVSNLADRAG